MSIDRRHSGPGMSQVVVHGNTVYLAGQVAQRAPGTSAAEQTRDILSRIDELLAEVGVVLLRKAPNPKQDLPPRPKFGI